jgi:hypothetical protein
VAPRVIPTLAAMADVYRRPVDERFDAYVELGRLGVPVAGWNPMTSKDVLGTVERLVAIDAETLAEEAAAEVAELLRIGEDVPLAVTVATPGMWTDRLATEVEHRIQGRGVGEVLLWTGEDCGRDAVRAAAAAQLVRESWRLRHGVPRTVGDAVAQEGLALAMAGMGGRLDDGAAQVLAVLREDTTLSSMVAFLYGDDAATAMGFTPVGLGARGGERHAVALVGR